MIPKADGSQRPLGIPTIRDRVAQMAVKLVIEPIFEADFCPNSYGFRPKKSAHDAVDEIAEALHRGHTKVIDADLSKYFDTILTRSCWPWWQSASWMGDFAPHQVVAQSPGDRRGRGRHTESCGRRQGKQQGHTARWHVISPLLSNCYLHLLDRIWERHQLCRKLKARIVRYADDFVVLCAGQVEDSLAMVRRVLDRLELTLNENKTASWMPGKKLQLPGV